MILQGDLGFVGVCDERAGCYNLGGIGRFWIEGDETKCHLQNFNFQPPVSGSQDEVYFVFLMMFTEIQKHHISIFISLKLTYY